MKNELMTSLVEFADLAKANDPKMLGKMIFQLTMSIVG